MTRRDNFAAINFLNRIPEAAHYSAHRLANLAPICLRERVLIDPEYEMFHGTTRDPRKRI